MGKQEISEEEWIKRSKNRIECNLPIRPIRSAMDIEIDKKGAIIDNMGNFHTTPQSYKDYLKKNDLVIKDWTPGTLKKNDSR